MTKPPSAVMKVKTVAIDKVLPYHQNARKWTGADVTELADAIREYGWRQPIVVDADGVIIVGHMRLAAATQLECKRVPVHVADDLSPEQVRAYRLADNRTGQRATWDDAMLLVELTELADGGELTVPGFDEGEITDILADAGDKKKRGGRGLGTPRIAYDLVFDSEEQQKTWYAFLRHLKSTSPYQELETAGARVALFVEEHTPDAT